MTLAELLQKVPEDFRPVAARYGPALLAMSAEELWAWIALLVNGQHDTAYRAVLAKLDETALLAEWDALSDRWSEANTDNAASLALQRAAVLATLRVLLTVALAMVGL